MKKNYILFCLIIIAVGACGQKNTKASTVKKDELVLSAFEKPIEPVEKVTRKEKKAIKRVQAQQKTVEEQASTKIKKVIIKEDSPLQVIQAYTAELQKLDAETQNDKSRDQKIASRVQAFFDFDRLSKGSLGNYWTKINANERKKYSSLFQQLVERSYLSKSKTLVGNYDLTFDKEKIKGSQASVACVVKKDDVDVDITYHLHMVSKKWMIYNIDFDSVNLMRNYETQFSRIIAKKGFSGLIGLMEKKLEDKTTDNAI